MKVVLDKYKENEDYLFFLYKEDIDALKKREEISGDLYKIKGENEGEKKRKLTLEKSSPLEQRLLQVDDNYEKLTVDGVGYEGSEMKFCITESILNEVITDGFSFGKSYAPVQNHKVDKKNHKGLDNCFKIDIINVKKYMEKHKEEDDTYPRIDTYTRAIEYFKSI